MRIVKAINKIYYAALNDLTERINGVSIQVLITPIRNNYAHIGQPKIKINMLDFHQDIYAAFPLADWYTHK